MTQKILAFFASSFLSVALTIPSLAEETGGIVASIDEERATLTLDDGRTFVLPGAFNFQAVQPGMQVHLIYTELDEDSPAS